MAGMMDQGSAFYGAPAGKPFRPAHDAQGPASLAELTGLATNRPGTATKSGAQHAELTRPQLNVLFMADNPSGCVSQNGSTGVTRPLIRALDRKGYGSAQYDMVRKYLIVGFRINERGRHAVAGYRP